MIYSIGHDIVENERINQLLTKYGDKIVNKILTAVELEIYYTRRDKVKFVAKRFAAKEAFAKACGTGLRGVIQLRNLSVLNDALGRPYFVVSPAVQDWLSVHQITSCHLSLSDERSLSSAFVVLEK